MVLSERMKRSSQTELLNLACILLLVTLFSLLIFDEVILFIIYSISIY